ncbi:BatD family protein [Jiulongibacter sediminis]|uniref:BatD family protein n=1 Tax=Jiulongibacter sediminis TaxID=1605367 RepID=UPI0026EC010D|nr:BatD family protein [Jiulongibacter sediminis]
MRWIHLILLFLVSLKSFSQKNEAQITTSGRNLSIGDEFTISIVIRDSKNSNVSELPPLPGLRKEGRSVSHSNVTIEGKRHLQHTISQKYIAVKSGEYDLPTFQITINGQKYEFPDTHLSIESTEEESLQDSLSTKDDALLFLFVNKKDIFVGEGFRMHLAFYVSEENTAEWEFPRNLTSQISEIYELLKPKNCVESRKKISSIRPEQATIGGKNYIRYKLFEVVYYPLSDGPIALPQVSLIMDQKTSAGDSSKVEKVPFFSRPFSLIVTPLPEHPLKNRISVGKYSLTDKPLPQNVQTGKILNYSIQISGSGNTNSLSFEKPANDSKFDFYPPSSSLNQSDGAETGSRTFNFKIFPKDSGSYQMGNYFEWIYFDTQSGTYDTLRPDRLVNVSGPTIITSSAQERSIYENLAEKSVEKREINFRKIVKNVANVVLFLMLVGMLFIFEFRRNKH